MEVQGDFQERVVAINRVAKVVKGGRRFSFSALVVAGSGSGDVGLVLVKLVKFPKRSEKPAALLKKSLKKMNLKEGRTIPHEVIGTFGAARVILIPAAAGTGVIAGGPVRAVLETVGIKDILTKCVGTRNPHNAVRATFDGLQQLMSKMPEKG